MRSVIRAIGTVFGLVVVGGALAACASGGGSGRQPGGDDDMSGGSDAGTGSGSGSDAPTGTLSIDPMTAELLIENGAAAHQKFTALLTLSDGTRRDVTAKTLFVIEKSYGAFSGSELTASAAGKTLVLAE